MEELIEEIKTSLNINNLRLTSAVYNKQAETLYITFVSDQTMSDVDRQKIIDLCKQRLIEKTVVKFVKNIVDEYVIGFVAKDFLTANYKTFATIFDFANMRVNLSDASLPVIEFKFTKELCDIFENSCKQPLLNFLNQQFFVPIVVKETIVEDEVNADEILNKRLAAIYNSTSAPVNDRIIFNDVCDLIGKNAAKSATPIKDIKGEMQGVNVCGTINFFKERTFKKERKGVEMEKKYYTFTLNDGTGKISVTVFATVANTPKLQKLADQTKVLIYGNVEIYNERLSLRVKSLALILDYKLKKAEQKFKAAPLEYKVVSPKKYENYTQRNWLEEQENAFEIDEFLLNNDIVVFDLETTGLNPAEDKITEIGAVKLVKGQLTECFATFVNPGKPIPPKVVKVTGITDQDVANAPTYNEVVGDFYKFCFNSILIAYNSEFDASFIFAESRNTGFHFDNKVIDAMQLAYKANIPTKNMKLNTILAYYGIVNKGAHRAFNDAEATAELVVRLGKYLKEL